MDVLLNVEKSLALFRIPSNIYFVTPRGQLDLLFSDLAMPLGFFVMELKTAILIDGSFFIQRVNFFKRKYFTNQPDLSAEQYIDILHGVIRRHLYESNDNQHYLYRTFYYDSAPLDLQIHMPLVEEGETNQRIMHFGQKAESVVRTEFLKLLRTQRKVTLRLGQIKHQKKWKVKDSVITELLKQSRDIPSLTNNDFYFESQQKGVDIKLGLDIASLAYEKLVDQIILIAGDSDFVPAAKLARMKGIDFVLDPLKNNIDPSLNEHIDGLNSFDLVSVIASALKVDPDVIPVWWDENKPVKKQKKSRRSNRR